ncbi:MAG: hypothetical protein PHE95_05175 [Candidatus Methanomethylophilus sp.]|nr:hypothetical protein [Methanomethylophilus sp.]
MVGRQPEVWHVQVLCHMFFMGGLRDDRGIIMSRKAKDGLRRVHVLCGADPFFVMVEPGGINRPAACRRYFFTVVERRMFHKGPTALRLFNM